MRREQRRIEREDEATRVAIEGKFEEGKRIYGLDCIATKLKETSETAIHMTFLLMNVMKITRDRMRSFFVLVLYYSQHLKNMASGLLSSLRMVLVS